MILHGLKDFYGSDDENVYFAEMLGTLPHENSDYVIDLYLEDIYTAEQHLSIINICFINEKSLYMRI